MVERIKRLVHEEFPFLFAAPALLWQSYFLYLPVIALLSYSFVNWTGGAAVPVLTLEHYKELINVSYLRVILNSFMLASLTAFSCLLIGYPIAHFLAFKAGRFKTIFLVFLILPSWTSFIVQVYSWFFLLKKGGLVSQLFYFIGLTSEQVHLLNTPFSLFIGMVYCYLPFMVFPLFAVLDRFDKTLLEVSADLGANRFETFRRVVFPISLPGVLAGLMLVFIPAFGEFAIPDLLGGSRFAFIGSVIVDKFLNFRDWQSGAAAVSLGVVIPLLLILTTGYAFMRLKKMAREYSLENEKQSYLGRS